MSTVRRRRGSGGWTLRARLLVVVAALLAAVSLVVGLVSVVALDRFLQGRLDEQLTAAVVRSRTAFEESHVREGEPSEVEEEGESHDAPRFLLSPGQAAGTLGGLVRDGSVVGAAVLDDRGRPVGLPRSYDAVLADLPVDGGPTSRDLGGRLGEYRFVAAGTPDGDVLVTGLPLRPVHDTVYRLTAVVVAVALAGLLAAVLAGAVVIRLALRPLRRVASTAGHVAEVPLDRGEVALAVRVPEQDTDPRTEVGQVGAALNHMLAHIARALTARQESENLLRRFVADASHELRTPLAVIRGYAEVTRRSPEAVPDDVVHALERVESEAIRMTALVDDLLLLARLDEGRPVERTQVDLSRIAVDAVSDAHAAGPDHHWDLEIPSEPVTVTGDRARLHQVVANLLANARAHTPPGTHVRLTLEAEPSTAVGPQPGDTAVVSLSVHDDGPGIPQDQQRHVFERFSRGDAARSRANGSTGLGLAIVAAVVAAHNGSVEVTSRPGHTVFTVRLPALAALPTALDAPSPS